MRDKRPRYTWSDAWLLFSIALADDGSGASLQSIIRVGDWANHAIFTGPELRRGFAKLLQAGYLTSSDFRFSLSGEALLCWKTDKNPRKSAIARMKSFEVFLEVDSTPSQDATFEDPDWPFPSITDAMIHEAYQHYLGNSRAMKIPRKSATTK
jgi:hypothetical protein